MIISQELRLFSQVQRQFIKVYLQWTSDMPQDKLIEAACDGVWVFQFDWVTTLAFHPTEKKAARRSENCNLQIPLQKFRFCLSLLRVH